MRKIQLLNRDNVVKLRKNEDWKSILVDKDILFEYLADYLLKSENLFYYASQKSSTTTLYDTKEYVKKLISLNILNQEIDSVLKSIGWEKKYLNIESTVFQGDLAEYLMCILIDNFFDIKTVISKVSLKTSSKVPSYGNDNIFYDYKEKKLYYGESKFYSNTSVAIDRAYSSLREHSNIQEISFIKSHTNSFIASSGEERYEIVEIFETVSAENFIIESIIFIVSDDIYEKTEIEKLLKSKGVISETEKVILVFLPVLSKEEFLTFFKERLI